MDHKLEKMKELALCAVVESHRKTWLQAGFRPKLFLKTKEQIKLDRTIADAFVRVLAEVFEMSFVRDDLEEKAIKLKLLTRFGPELRHKDDQHPNVMENTYIVKGKP